MFVLDSHCDTPSQIIRLRDMSQDNDHAHVDFPKLKRGGIDGAFFALYIPASLDEDADKAFEYASRLLGAVEDSVSGNSDKAAFARTVEEAYENKSRDLFSVFLGLENASPIAESFDRLKWFYDRGVRYITLCHSKNNQVCDSSAEKQEKWGGLSPFGKKLVAEMNRLGMLIDVSHISDKSFYDVLKYSDRPVVATHSCCRALSEHPRNMSDEMVKALAAAGGVIQVNFYPLFLDSSFIEKCSAILERGQSVDAAFTSDPSDPEKRAAWYKVLDELSTLKRPSFKLIADHIDHVVSLVGIDHVGIGSDFDGIEVTPEGMDDISGMPLLFDELRRRGYSESDLEKIAGGNFFRCASGFSGAEQ